MRSWRAEFSGAPFATCHGVGISKSAATVRAIVIATFAMVGTGAIVSGDALRVEFDSATVSERGVPTSADDIHLESSPIPEPAALSLLGLGLLAVGRTVRSRQRS